MSKYSCEICLKEFLQKSKYDVHKKRKTPCINLKKEYIEHMKEINNNLILEEPKEPNDLKLIKYSDISYKLTKEISKNEKKEQGIYFTPPNTIQTNINFLEPYIKDITSVLEPACGSCEYIIALNEKFQHLNITGI